MKKTEAADIVATVLKRQGHQEGIAAAAAYLLTRAAEAFQREDDTQAKSLRMISRDVAALSPGQGPGEPSRFDEARKILLGGAE